jgi:hypothetical protein
MPYSGLRGCLIQVLRELPNSDPREMPNSGSRGAHSLRNVLVLATEGVRY